MSKNPTPKEVAWGIYGVCDYSHSMVEGGFEDMS